MFMGFGAIFTLLGLGGLAYMLGWRPQSTQQVTPLAGSGSETALDILQKRYARGEITKTEYEEIRDHLQP